MSGLVLALQSHKACSKDLQLPVLLEADRKLECDLAGHSSFED